MLLLWLLFVAHCVWFVDYCLLFCWWCRWCCLSYTDWRYLCVVVLVVRVVVCCSLNVDVVVVVVPEQRDYIASSVLERTL